MKPSQIWNILSKNKLENDNVQDFDTKWDEVWSAVTDRHTYSILESLYQIRVDESEELKYLLQVYAQETTVGDKKCDCCKIEVDGPKTSRAEKSRILMSKREIETRTDLQ